MSSLFERILLSGNVPEFIAVPMIKRMIRNRWGRFDAGDARYRNASYRKPKEVRWDQPFSQNFYASNYKLNAPGSLMIHGRDEYVAVREAIGAIQPRGNTEHCRYTTFSLNTTGHQHQQFSTTLYAICMMADHLLNDKKSGLKEIRLLSKIEKYIKLRMTTV